MAFAASTVTVAVEGGATLLDFTAEQNAGPDILARFFIFHLPIFAFYLFFDGIKRLGIKKDLFRIFLLDVVFFS